jgi:hypothetical protein
MSDKKIIPFDSKTLSLMLSAFVAILIAVLMTLGVTVFVTDVDTAQRDQEFSGSM